MKTAFLSCLFAAAALACSPANIAAPTADAATSDVSSPGDGGDSGGDAAPSGAKVCKDYAYARCTRLQTCSSTELATVFGDVQTCESYFETSCKAVLAAPSTSATLDHYVACTSAIPAWNCPDFVKSENEPPACQPMAGGLANGAPCGVGAQCQSTFCLRPTGMACGKCAPVPKAGDPCTSGGQCAPGQACQKSTGQCVNYSQLGEACGTGQPCNDGLTCVSGTCVAAVTTSGAACSFSGAGCDGFSGLTCDPATGKCATMAVVAPGKACGLVDGKEVACLAGTCVRGTCAAEPLVGQACELAAGLPCLAFSHCIVTTDGGMTGTCQIEGSATCN